MPTDNNEISGFFLIDKPENCSSFDLIRDLRRKSKHRKFGHTGTLDPFASGLVVLCLNKATKLSSFILDSDKDYLVKMELGTKTDTGDRDGTIIQTDAVPQLTQLQIKEAVKSIRSLKEQKPPSYSAKKIKGKAAYKYAREGKEVDLPLKEINIYDFNVISISDNIIIYRTKVSKGTYVRTLSETFAELLGTVAYTTELRRLSIGPLSVQNAVKLSDITADNWLTHLKPINSIIFDYPKVNLPKSNILSFLNGNSVFLDSSFIDETTIKHNWEETLLDSPKVIVYANDSYNNINKGDCLGVALIKEGVLYPQRIL